uniref:Uncharacterized protein LOC113796573 n=1 Tax=Dermatophagoides pteronyssinus TaxID=6956 RepID=A0A6P6YBM9_DERPT|nr:uncharacterized protein LOC113796573 [Dermatophagoides pteronyssinus]XP_027202685.1 uncharacterized protein LOC113796573 [Dermatophagoides pteronyssinus]
MNTSLKGLVLLQKCNQRLHASNQGLSQQVHCYYLLVDEYSRPLSVLSVVVIIIQQPQLRPRTTTTETVEAYESPAAAQAAASYLSLASKTSTKTTFVDNDKENDNYDNPYYIMVCISHQASPELKQIE